MSHSARGPLIEQEVLSDCSHPSSEAGPPPEEQQDRFDPAQQAEITRRHTELLDKLLGMPVKDRGPYLEAAAKAAADDYENDPSLTEFTALDGEDFEDYSE